MLIDWFTVGAQVLNFLILVWLLKRFLYGPILDAIDARLACRQMNSRFPRSSL
jgi:F-type H+-transporting ATPase subunit b